MKSSLKITVNLSYFERALYKRNYALRVSVSPLLLMCKAMPTVKNEEISEISFKNWGEKFLLTNFLAEKVKFLVWIHWCWVNRTDISRHVDKLMLLAQFLRSLKLKFNVLMGFWLFWGNWGIFLILNFIEFLKLNKVNFWR